MKREKNEQNHPVSSSDRRGEDYAKSSASFLSPTEKAGRGWKKQKKLWIFILILAVLFFCNHHFGWNRYWKDADHLKSLKTLVDDNLWAAIGIYLLFTIIGCVALALPGITFALLGGMLFGPWLGTLCCLIGTTLGAIVSFGVGRYFLRDSLKPVVMKNSLLKKWLFDESGDHQMILLMITRLVPLFPFNLQNFAYGVTDIPFSTYTLGTFVFLIPGTAAYTIGAAGITDERNRFLYLGIALVLVVCVALLGIHLKKRYHIAGAEDPEGAEES